MRMVALYQAKAAELDELARRFNEASVKKRYMDMADAYRLLAEDRKRHVGDKKLGRKVPPQSD